MTIYTNNHETYSRLIGSGQVDDRLLWRLVEMAGHDMQRAEVEIDALVETATIRQWPHQGEPRTTTAYLPIGPIVAEWLDAEAERTGSADIYGYTAAEVELIREDIEIAANE